MRKTMLGLTILLALVLCTLVPGTPVNNDPSPAAKTAGIHVTTPVSHSRTTQLAAAPLLAAVVAVAVFLLSRSDGPTVVVRADRSGHLPRSLRRAWSGARRAPPLGA